MSKVDIITVSKVASASFAYSMARTRINGGPLYKVYHSHSLEDLRDILNNQSDRLIISGIRNPLDRNISYFFQGFHDNFYNTVKMASNNYQGELCYIEGIENKTAEEMIDIFFDQKWHYTFNDWFEEFMELTGITEFDKDKGYQMYELKNGNKLLFYTFEKLDENSDELSKLLKIKNIPNTNIRINNTYKEFKQLIKFPDEYKEKLLMEPHMHIFYTNEQLDKFWQSYCLDDIIIN